MIGLADHPRDIVVTWPQKRSLGSYLDELDRAVSENLVVNYKVARLPRWPDQIEDHGHMGWAFGVKNPKCYMVYSGRVRGWLEILYTAERMEGEVDGWPAGLYIVRNPQWHPVTDIRLYPGFRGWRWYDHE